MKCKKFIFAASIMEVEVANIMKTQGDCPIGYLYSATKLAVDYRARTIANEEGICYISGLLTNIYGEGENSPRLINSSIKKY